MEPRARGLCTLLPAGAFGVPIAWRDRPAGLHAQCGTTVRRIAVQHARVGPERTSGLLGAGRARRPGQARRFGDLTQRGEHVIETLCATWLRRPRGRALSLKPVSSSRLLPAAPCLHAAVDDTRGGGTAADFAKPGVLGAETAKLQARIAAVLEIA